LGSAAGSQSLTTLSDLLAKEAGASLPHAAVTMLKIMLEAVEVLDRQIAELDKEIARRAREDVVVRRLMTVPGIAAITATAIAALAPPLEEFRRGRDFAAWLGLTPLQKSTGGKQRLGKMSKMGERTIRRLLIIGASSVVRHASRPGAPERPWLAGMLARKPRMLVTVAQANKTARIVWAVLTKAEDYRAPVAKAA
jgi:transposase